MKCLSIIFFFISSLLYPFIIHAQKTNEEFTIISGQILASTEFKVEKLDPFIGIQVALIKPGLRGSIELNYGKVQESFDVGKITGDDYLYGFSLDYLWGEFPGGKLIGSYWGIGAGYYWERVKWTSEILDFRSEDTLKASSYILEVVAGYLMDKVELFGAYVFLPDSENVTGALKVGIGFYIDGKK